MTFLSFFPFITSDTEKSFYQIPNISLCTLQDCHPEQLFSESKFLCQDSLLELTKALTFGSRGPEHHQTLGTLCDEDSAVFFLELLVSVALENK